MSLPIQIEPVPWRKRAAAMQVVVGGAMDDPIQQVRLEALRQLATRQGRKSVRLWWARRERRSVCAAMIVATPGKTGMLFHTPTSAEGVEVDSLIELLRRIAADALSSGLSMVQARLEADASADIEVIEAAGFELLANLLRMKLNLGRLDAPRADPSLTWRNCDQFDDGELGEVIRRTYEGSLDCSVLTGLRRMEDVLAGYKASGAFRPKAWWLVERNAQPAGCVLVNDSLVAPFAEVVYLAVVPEHRGCGLGRALLARAAYGAQQRGRNAMILAVDGDNHYAKALYESAGFRQSHCQPAYIMR